MLKKRELWIAQNSISPLILKNLPKKRKPNWILFTLPRMICAKWTSSIR